MTKTLLSGVKPTGRPHIGNYFGAMKQFVDLQSEYQSFLMIADYHALNFIQNGEELRQLILDLAIDYLAIGLDPEKATIFKQSDVSEHTELTWIFDTITTMPYLARAHAFKAALENIKDSKPAQRLVAKKIEGLLPEISVGTFNYPMLMAADILLYGPDVVPVGQDQKQHVEYARDTAEKFNRIFGETFKLPKDLIMKEVETVPGTDGRKMSKSYGNTIGLFASDEEIDKAVAGIVTDSVRDDEESAWNLVKNSNDPPVEVPRPVNVYRIHRLLKSDNELSRIYADNKGQYKILKDALVADLKAFIGPLREKREQIAGDKNRVLEVLKNGGEKARAVASAKMETVRQNIGVKLN